MKRYESLHKGFREFKCQHYGKSFSATTHLKNHMNTHQKITPFKCSLCVRYLVSGSALKVHIQSHTGGSLTIVKFVRKHLYTKGIFETMRKLTLILDDIIASNVGKRL